MEAYLTVHPSNLSKKLNNLSKIPIILSTLPVNLSTLQKITFNRIKKAQHIAPNNRRHTGLSLTDFLLQLTRKQLIIKTLLLQQFPVGAFFDDLALFQNEDLIRFLNRVQPVRDDKACSPFHQAL